MSLAMRLSGFFLAALAFALQSRKAMFTGAGDPRLFPLGGLCRCTTFLLDPNLGCFQRGEL